MVNKAQGIGISMTIAGLGAGAAAAYLGLTGKISKIATAAIGTGGLLTASTGSVFTMRGCRQAARTLRYEAIE